MRGVGCDCFGVPLGCDLFLLPNVRGRGGGCVGVGGSVHPEIIVFISINPLKLKMLEWSIFTC